MTTAKQESAINTITTHYIDGVLVESHGKEVMDIRRHRGEVSNIRASGVNMGNTASRRL